MSREWLNVKCLDFYADSLQMKYSETNIDFLLSSSLLLSGHAGIQNRTLPFLRIYIRLSISFYQGKINCIFFYFCNNHAYKYIFRHFIFSKTKLWVRLLPRVLYRCVYHDKNLVRGMILSCVLLTLMFSLFYPV